MKSLQTLVVAALLAPMTASIPTTTASSTCEEAALAFQEAFVAAGFGWTPSNAQLLASAVEACGNTLPANPDESVAQMQATADATLLKAQAAAQSELLARDCGVTTIPSLSVDAAEITAITLISMPMASKAEKEAVWGPATATYDPGSNLTTYSGRGTTGENGAPPKWGFDAWNSGSVASGLPQATRGYAVVYLYGVPIPAVYVTGYGDAKAGCTEDTLGTVCWARGDARVALTTMITITVHGKFTTC